jgi:DNA-binding XRE family transcriptional regulator
MTRWNRAAMRISACRHDSAQGTLSVSFDNGDQFDVAVESLVAESTIDEAQWGNMRIGETHDYLLVPVGDGVTEIPWDRIRAVADAEFRRHLSVQASASRQRVADRLGQLRRARGLTQQAVAEAANLPRRTISQMENGQSSPSYETLSRMLAALGCSMEDLALDEEPTLELVPGKRRD